MDWVDLFAKLGSFAIGAGVLAYLFKILLEHLFSKDLETFKADLRRTTELALKEHEVRFSGVYARQAEVVAHLYEKLARAEHLARELMKPIKFANDAIEQDQVKAGANAVNAFIEYYGEHQLFLPDNVCAEIDRLVERYLAAFGQFTTFPREMLKDADPEMRRLAGMDRIGAWKVVSEEIPTIKKSIESFFRRLIGVTKIT